MLSKLGDQQYDSHVQLYLLNMVAYTFVEGSLRNLSLKITP